MVAAAPEPLHGPLHGHAAAARSSRATTCTAGSARSRSPTAACSSTAQPLNLRGVGLHEDSKAEGFAIDDARRDELLTDVKELGGNVIRTHYPLHPYTHELADRLGILIWSEIPVYSVKTQYLKEPTVRRLAIKELGKNIETNQNHPSVMLWSIGNELSSQPGPVQVAYIDAAVKFAHQMDPTRPVGLAVAAYPSSLCQAAQYKSLDVLGLNDYFGWYPGPSGQIFDRTLLPGYLDAARACYPDKALFVTEFGAESNRDGPAEEKGTWAFQQDFVNYHLGVFATKPWLSGAIYWALNEFWVRPGWDGGDPRPQPPVFQKGLITYDGVRKPAWTDVQRWFTQTQQFDPAGHAGDLGAAPPDTRGDGAGSTGLAVAHVASLRVGELVVAGAQPRAGLDGIWERDAAGWRGLGLVGDAVVAAAAGVVFIV